MDEKIISILKKKKVDFSFGVEEDVKEFIPTGILAIDWVLGNKGIPVGRLTELYGDYSSGKSWLLYKVLGEAQKRGMVAVLVETENSFSSEWVRKCNLMDVDNLLLVKPFYIEEVFEVLFELLEKVDERLIIGWDSIAVTPSKSELEAGFSKRDLTKAQIIGQGLRMILRLMEKKGATVIIVNQLREKIGQVFGEVEFTPGGRSVGYVVSLRIRMHRKSKVRIGDFVVGQKIKVECTKSKVFEPFRSCEVEFLFGKGIDRYSGVLEILEELKVVESNNGWYQFKGDNRKWREGDFYEMIVTGDEKLREVISAVFGTVADGAL